MVRILSLLFGRNNSVIRLNMGLSNTSHDDTYSLVSHGAAVVGARANGFMARLMDGYSTWSLLLTLLLAAVFYDQS